MEADFMIHIKEMNLFEKMQLITNEIGVVEKGLQVRVTDKSSYKAVSERDVLDAVKPIEQKYRVFSLPISRKIIAQDVLEKVSEYNGKTSKTYTMYMRIETTYRFYNIDKPDEYIDTITYADGLDTGDKASGKAMTYADKYALMKAYKISTGDDPDKEASAEQGYTSVKATPKQIEAVKKLVRDTQAMLDHYNISKIEDLTLEQASDIIAKKGGSNGQ